jgi:hypothetical protein
MAFLGKKNGEPQQRQLTLTNFKTVCKIFLACRQDSA